MLVAGCAAAMLRKKAHRTNSSARALLKKARVLSVLGISRCAAGPRVVRPCGF